jgi:hypothetical protein
MMKRSAPFLPSNWAARPEGQAAAPAVTEAWQTVEALAQSGSDGKLRVRHSLSKPVFTVHSFALATWRLLAFVPSTH